VKALKIYSTAIAPEWIDYNGHLRDAYYGLILSYACDALMDQVGLDAAYRRTTTCTLYTLEQHMHFLHEVKQADQLDILVRVLAADRKRIHAAFDFYCERYTDPVALGEMMLLHVRQDPGPAAVAFPAPIMSALETLVASTSGLEAPGPPSRRIELRVR
jgi:acyl-CoA thioester hydrolase